MGLQAYGFSPFILDAGEWRRVHGNDERVSVDNIVQGARIYTEMLETVAAA
jgi:acetylornithine deacetylase/succinyl-diaminopimelate desuccinylase-like protein